MEIQVYRNNVVQTVFDTGDQTVFKHQLMGEHKIEAHFTSYAVLPIQLGDYINHQGEKFYINQVPSVIKHSNAAYEYAINFEGEIYRLYNKLFMHEGATEFDYFGDAEALLTLIVNNINQTDSDWTIGTVAASESKSFHFENDTCRTALTKIANEFQLEFLLSAREISLINSVGHDTTLMFEYGKGKGLYQLTRNAIDDKNVVTRVYAFGGDKNLAADYRSGQKKLVFESRYLEANTALYGIIEGVANFPDIYPRRTGTVTSTSAINKIIDTGIDFNINDYLLEGQTATIVFKTGDLAVSEFEISNYNAVTKEIRFNPVTEANDYQLPNDDFKPAIGDTYTLVNIKMPQNYINAAEAQLLNEATEWLSENDHPRVSYALNIDRFHAKTNGIELHIGDKVQVKDIALNVDSTIRAIGISYPLIDPFRITANIADFVAYTAEEKAIARGIDTSREVVEVDRTRTEASRRNAMRYKELQGLIFDPDGKLNPGLLTSEMIQTLLAIIGTDSMNFHLSGVLISPNYLGDVNALHISAGQLLHHVYEIEGLGDTWDIIAATFSNLDPAKPYYVYAKCSKSQLSGTWEISEAPIHTNDIVGFYAFNLGILYKVANGYRDFAFTNGQTVIVGDNITTGRIQDLSGQNYFDLNSGKFNIGDNNYGLDWDVTNPNRLTIRGGITVNAGGVEEPLGVFRGEYDSSFIYYQGDTLTYSGSYWKVISSTSVTGTAPNDSDGKFKLLAKKGDAGTNAGNRVMYAKNSDADNPPSVDIYDENPVGWSATMPAIDTQWLLSTDEGDYIVNNDGDQYLTTVDGEYIWAITESLDGTGAFDHWMGPTRITGRNGIPTEYTEYRYQKNGSPSVPPSVVKTDAIPALWGIPMPEPGPAEYVWMIKANKLPNGTLVSAWSTPIRVSPVDGGAASTGDPGPFLMFRGEWNKEGACGDTVHKLYSGTNEHIDAVKYNGSYYVARQDAGNIPVETLPTNTTYWNQFVGEFESMATGLLLAQIAYIENLGVNYLRTSETGQRIEITGVSPCEPTPSPDANSMIFYDENDNEVLRIDDDIDTQALGDPVAGIRANNPVNSRISYMTGKGIFSNASNTVFLAPSTGLTTNASVVGLLFERNADYSGISAGVVGIDGTNVGNAKSWGGYFNSAKVEGKMEVGTVAASALILGTKIINAIGNYYLNAQDTIVNTYHTSGTVNLYLPTAVNLEVGRVIIIRRINSGALNVYGNSNQILTGNGGGRNSIVIDTVRGRYTFIWDGSFWQSTGLK